MYENFHKLSKETKILKIGLCLLEIGNYNFFENFEEKKSDFFSEISWAKNFQPLNVQGAGLFLLLILNLRVSFKGSLFQGRVSFKDLRYEEPYTLKGDEQVAFKKC